MGNVAWAASSRIRASYTLSSRALSGVKLPRGARMNREALLRENSTVISRPAFCPRPTVFIKGRSGIRQKALRLMRSGGVRACQAAGE